MASLFSLFVSGVVLILLTVPPAIALLMLIRRLLQTVPHRRMPYQALVALVGLGLAFNLLVWVGMPTVLRGLLPELITRNLGLSGLLVSWGSVGICMMLAVLHPYRQRSNI